MISLHSSVIALMRPDFSAFAGFSPVRESLMLFSRESSAETEIFLPLLRNLETSLAIISWAFRSLATA